MSYATYRIKSSGEYILSKRHSNVIEAGFKSRNILLRYALIASASDTALVAERNLGTKRCWCKIDIIGRVAGIWNARLYTKAQNEATAAASNANRNHRNGTKP